MANYEKVEEVFEGIYRLTHKRSVQRQGAGMVKVGSTEWPEETVEGVDVDDNPTTTTRPAQYALLIDGGYVAATQADIEAAREARRQAKEEAALEASNAQHESEAPQGDLSAWNKRERCLLLVCYKLAQQHWPNITKAAFLKNVKAEWDAVKGC